MRVQLLHPGQVLCGAPRLVVKAFYSHLSDALLAGLTGLTAVLIAFIFLCLSGAQKVFGR